MQLGAPPVSGQPTARPEHVRVVIADRRRLIAGALAALIGARDGFTITGANLSGPDPAATIIAQDPDIVVIGLGVESEQALELARRLRRGLPGGAIVIVADVLEPELVAERNDPVDTLSGRQLEVLRLLADGCSYEEIGSRLFITANTVKFHVRSIFERLGVRNRMAAARMLAKHHAH